MSQRSAPATATEPAPSFLPFRSGATRRQRTLTLLLCGQFLLSACQATSVAPGDGASWPEPAPAPRPAEPSGPVMTTPPQWPANAVVRTVPNFQAPSATQCAGPMRTREIPGAEAGQNDRGERRTMREGAASAEPLRSRREEGKRKASGEALADRAAGSGAASEAEAPYLAAPPPSPPAPAIAAPAGAVAASPEMRAMPIHPLPRPTPSSQAPRQRPVTAGMVDDNADFAEYLRFRDRTQVAHRARDVRERYLLQVRNDRGAVVPDAEVAVRASNGSAMWARTDAGGRVWLHPDAFDSAGSALYEVAVRKNGRQSTAFLRRGQKSAVDVVLRDTAAPSRARLDLVFLVDATGSMADEIGRLKTTLRAIASEVAQLPSRPDTCFGLVAYRDKGDAFLLRSHDFTNDLDAFQRVLNALQADGGGDYPEAMNEALHETVHRLSWRGSGATRMVVLLADAPPHLDYAGPQYDDDMLAALGKGIKVFSVGASGLDKQGEYVQRQIAQYTGGRFVFLTYKEAERPSSGPGRETVHDVRDYSVQTLDRLIVRLVSEELGRLPNGAS